jgi:hemoglobin-like flavoprotein
VAKRGREAALKRAREKARQEKKEAKRERALARQSETEAEEPVDEQALMEQFARLSESHDSNRISQEAYEKERQRIFTALGIEDG